RPLLQRFSYGRIATEVTEDTERSLTPSSRTLCALCALWLTVLIHLKTRIRQTREVVTTALIESMLHRKTERVDDAVVRRQINLAPAARQRGAARKRRDRRSAVPKLFAGLAVERIEDCARRTPRPLRRIHLTVVSTKLAAGGYKDHAVDDRRRQRRNQIARGPG